MISDITTRVYEARAQRVLFGAGHASEALRGELQLIGSQRILLVAGQAEVEHAALITAGLPVVATFTDVRQHVPAESATQARLMAREAHADVVVCVGGGSTTGTAKVVALTEKLPIVAVPTTYAGSEATDVWGLTHNERKTNGSDPVVLPRSVIYDAELTVTLPPRLSVTSGLNALAHCVDALWGPSPSAPATGLATEGIRLLRQALPAVLADGGDLLARAEAQEATYVAASAFASAGSGLHHKICHVLGGAFGLDHAAMHAVLLPHVVGFNAPAADQAASRIAAALAPSSKGTALELLLDFYDEIDAPRSLGALGLKATDVGQAAELALAKVPQGNPRPVREDQLRDLIGRAQAGEAPVEVAYDTAKETSR
ncbi:maleylacetate reductase [Streptomyces sp. NPDC090106]|uniref:maleylacetate reductase n=1 Tax=Streptomyces sp. NPDC090106 TaxID=3365946 RepID=UPI0037F3FA2D